VSICREIIHGIKSSWGLNLIYSMYILLHLKILISYMEGIKMSKKIITSCLVMFSLCIGFVSVFAVTDYTTLNSKLDSIIVEARELVSDYNSFLTENEAVLQTISSYEDANALKGNMLKEDVVSIINSVLNDLNELGTTEALQAKNELENIKLNAETLVDDSKDVVKEVKANYENYTTDEITELVEKVQGMVEEFGITNSNVPSYSEIKTQVETVCMHADVLQAEIQFFVDDYHEMLFDNVSEALLNKLLEADSIDEVINILETELDSIGTTQSVTAKEDLKYIKSIVENLKADAEVLAKDFKESYVFLKESEIDAIKQDLQNVIDLYVDYAKKLIDTYSDTYIGKIKDKIYNTEPITVITKIDDMIDKAYEYEQKIIELKDKVVGKASSYLPVLVVFGYDKDDITNYVEEKIDKYKDKVSNRLVDEFDEYLSHMQDKYKSIIVGIKNATADIYTVRQTNISKEIKELFDVRTNFVSLLNRVSSEIENRINEEESKSDILDLMDTYEDVVLNAIDEIVLYAVEANFAIEEEIFTYLSDERIFVFSDFSATSVVKNISGIDLKYFTYAGLQNNKIATSTKALIKLSDTIQEVYQFAVIGDVNSDGAWDISDVVMVIDESINKTNLAGVEYIAADLNSDDVCDITDVVMSIDKGLQL